MVLAQKREKFKKTEDVIGKFFSKFSLSPNFYTLISIILALFAFYFLINVKLFLAFIFFILAALCDFIDGAVARAAQKVTKIGAYLDTISDRYVEGIILLGFLFLPLPKIGLSPQIWIFLALFGSLLTTYAKAAAKEKELIKLEFKKGIFGKAERIILLSLSIILGIFNFFWMMWAIIILAFLSNLSAIGRIYLAITRVKKINFKIKICPLAIFF